MRRRILVVDDDEDLCELLSIGLQDKGFSVETANTIEAAEQALRTTETSAILCDVYLGEEDGLQLCASATQNYPNTPFVIMTGQGDMDVAVRAIRAGAYDFIAKPIKLDAVALLLRRALELSDLRHEVQRLRDEQGTPSNIRLIGESRGMRKVFQLISQLAESDVTALITGESGTGKELAARSIHEQSNRKDGPFVAINCAAVTPTLLESELFGHVKGSFTGAQRDRPGLFVQASGGTLFLDELGEMSLDMQAKLLRVLQESRVRPVGGDSEIAFDTRIVAATNRDLETEVEEDRFREDLFYRVNVVRVEMPPLRSRGKDILALAQFFLEAQQPRTTKKVVGIMPEAAQKLLAYDWPGNVRELENAIEHAVTLTLHDHVVPKDLPSRIVEFQSSKLVVETTDPETMPTLEEMERRYIRRVLDVTSGNKTQAARVLGVNRRTMYRKMERLGIEENKG